MGSKYNKSGTGKGVEDHHSNGTKLGKNKNGNKDKDNNEKNHSVDKRVQDTSTVRVSA